MNHSARHILVVARWLLPWIGALLISSFVAYAADGGLRRVLVEPSTMLAPGHPITGDSSVTMLRGIRIEILDHDGKPVTHLTCLADAEAVTSESIQISNNHFDVGLYLRSLCVTPAEVVPAPQSDPH